MHHIEIAYQSYYLTYDLVESDSYLIHQHHLSTYFRKRIKRQRTPFGFASQCLKQMLINQERFLIPRKSNYCSTCSKKTYCNV